MATVNRTTDYMKEKMLFANPRNRSISNPRVWNTAVPPRGDTVDPGYFSVNSSFDDGHLSYQSERIDCSSENMSVSDCSRESPPYFKAPPSRERIDCSSDNMSVSDCSRESPLHFKAPPSRQDNTTTTSSKKQIKATQKELSPGEAAAFCIVLVVITIFVCKFFTKESSLNQDVKIVLPDSSGEVRSATETDKLLNEIISLLKQEVEARVRAEVRLEGGTSQDSGLVCLIKLVFLVLSALFICVISPDIAKALQNM